ncbi:MAG: DNA polymerase-3 subunit delta' [Alphaproteobacteria bacterium]
MPPLLANGSASHEYQNMTTEDQNPRVPSPRENPYFEGHEGAESELLAATSGGRVHHAWLITGPKGIGKATLAYRFARHLLANPQAEAQGPALFAPEEAPSCSLALDPESPTFRRISAGGHADLLSVERGFMDEGKGGRGANSKDNKRRRRSEIVIGDVRKVGEFLSLTAIEGGWRVVIVDGAEDMNPSAANALLKTLEEPPNRAILLLLSHAPGRLLPTIRSRCRRLTLERLEEARVESLIARYRPDLGPDEARALARIGDGSIGQALTLADAGGLALYEELVHLLSELPRPGVTRMHGALDAIARTRDATGAYQAYEVFTDLLTGWLMRLVTARARGIEPLEIMPGENEIAARLIARADLDQWVEVWEKITRLFGRASRLNLDRKQVLLEAFFALGRTAT